MKTLFVAAVTALAAVVKADYYVDPESVDPSDRAAWCQSELSTCPIICNQIVEGDPLVNECDPDTLTYGCICADQRQPNVSEYTLTLPYFTCMEWGNQCVKACSGNNACANSCREDNPCGAQDPYRPNSTATTTSSAAKETASKTSDSAGAVNTNVLGADQDGDKGAAVRLGREFGLAGLAGVMFAAFALL